MNKIIDQFKTILMVLGIIIAVMLVCGGLVLLKGPIVKLLLNK